ncbi:MAG: PAS domain S-box protein [Imperialibacter sp.]
MINYSTGESEARLSAIFDHAIDGIITIDEKGIVESMNPAAARLFGYEPVEVLGQNIKMLMPEPDRSRHDTYLENYRTTGVKKIIGIGREVSGKRKDGSKFPLYLSVTEIQFEGKTIFTGIIHDITELKLSREKLRRYAAELERSNRELQDFAYVSSHDLQEPLRKIQAFGDRLLHKEAPNLSEQGQDYLARMLNAAGRMQRLINDLLSFSRISSKTREFVQVDLNQVLAEVLTDLELLIEQTETRVEASDLPTIDGDYTQLAQVFQNLISNAIKFVRDGEKPRIKISARAVQEQAHLTATPGDETVEITFQDNGTGFDQKYADRIFHIFQRLEGQKFEGSGIGLAICKRVANRHGGDIVAIGTPGVGSTFILTLSKRQTRHEN